MMETDLLQTYFTACLLGFLQSVGRFGDHGSRSTPKLRVSSQYQYRETDWEFLKRAASRLGMPLVADCQRPRPRFYLGLREGEIRELPATGHTRRVVEGERYYRLREKGMAVERRNFLGYDIIMGANMDLGERVRGERHGLHVHPHQRRGM